MKTPIVFRSSMEKRICILWRKRIFEYCGWIRINQGCLRTCSLILRSTIWWLTCTPWKGKQGCREDRRRNRFDSRVAGRTGQLSEVARSGTRTRQLDDVLGQLQQPSLQPAAAD